MIPPKKAAKKSVKRVAKKSARKVAKKSAKHLAGHHQPNHLRRAYEHLGRVEILQVSLMPADAKVVTELATLARQELVAGNNKDAAELLRGSEHLCFAALADNSPDSVCVSTDLQKSIAEQFKGLLEKADEHWEGSEKAPGPLTAIYQNSCKNAAKALKNGIYHQALEFARAAEALAHVKRHGIHKLEKAKKALNLAAK